MDNIIEKFPPLTYFQEKTTFRGLSTEGNTQDLFPTYYEWVHLKQLDLISESLKEISVSLSTNDKTTNKS